MRRWNGWGFTQVRYPMNHKMRHLLAQQIGKGKGPRDATLKAVIATVPESRLTDHHQPFPAPINKDPETRIRYACGQSVPDWIAMRSGEYPAFPDGVAFPETSEQVRDLLDWAQANQVVVIPYGGGTSVAGQVTAYPQPRPILTLSLERLNSFMEFDKQSLLARFGAGITGLDLEAQLKPLGYTLGHFPQSFELSTLGGWIATRSKGQQSLRFGGIEPLFAGGRVETMRGTLLLPPFPGTAAGPDLREFILGSEGRYGIITEAVVRISPIPETEDIYGCFFPSWNAGLEAIRELIQSDLSISMLRLSNAKETEAQLAIQVPLLKKWLLEKWMKFKGIAENKCLLLIGFSGNRDEVSTTKNKAFRLIKKQGGASIGTSPGEHWKKSRFTVPYLRESLWHEGYIVDTLETSCLWNQVESMVLRIESALEKALSQENERVFAFSHLSHPYPARLQHLYDLPLSARQKPSRIPGALETAQASGLPSNSHRRRYHQPPAWSRRRPQRLSAFRKGSDRHRSFARLIQLFRSSTPLKPFQIN